MDLQPGQSLVGTKVDVCFVGSCTNGRISDLREAAKVAQGRQALHGQHPFDNAVYRPARVLVVNKNFGCGSSREHAPQGLLRWGIRAIVGESFSAIFFANCQAIGLPCVTAAPEVISQLQAAIAADPSQEILVDLENQRLQCGALTAEISLPAQLRQSFLTGDWDVCGLLVRNQKQIKATAAKLPYLQV